MCSRFKKRSKSLDDIENICTSDFHSSKYLSSNWADIKFVKHLNLIDYNYKTNSCRSIPWANIPTSVEDILLYCHRTIYSVYKSFMIKQITFCDDKILSSLIRKLLYVTKLFNFAYDASQTSCLYYKIICSLFDKGYHDPTLFLSIWNILCVLDSTKVAVFSSVIGRDRKKKSAKLLKYIIEAAHSSYFNFWGAWSKGHPLNNFNYCPVTAALLSGNLEQMTILLQYGFEPNSQRLCTYDKHFMASVNCVYEWLRIPLQDNASERRKMITEVLLFLISIANCRSRQRQLSMAQCFLLLWNTMSTPHVTKQELQNEIHLRFLYPPHFSQPIYYRPTTESEFLKVCEFYPDMFFGDERTTLQPRSLKHLCKCTIRTQLLLAWNLPNGIKTLSLPNQLKSYLELGNAT